MGLLQACISKADARDLLSDGASIPEAPRLIVDVLGTLERLHFHLQARGEFEKVGRKPFGGEDRTLAIALMSSGRYSSIGRSPALPVSAFSTRPE